MGDGVAELIGGGLNLLDGLFYTDQERARDATAQANASAQQAQAAAQIAISRASAEQTKMIALVAAGALLVGVIVWKVL
jgi:hypothetical protein